MSIDIGETTSMGNQGNTSTPTPTVAIQLISNDGETFIVDQEFVKQSKTIKEMCESVDDTTSLPIPLKNVKGSILKAIIQFCNYHKDDVEKTANDDDDDDDPNKDIYEPKRSDDISDWDKEFIKNFGVEDGTLFDIMMASNFLGVKTLLALGCKTIANMVRGKNSDEVRKMFNISYDPPGEGLNAPQSQAIESSAPAISEDSTNENCITDAPDPMNE